ncbi:hypothetical protein HNR06_000395 [Nocardiopsis arvandica]|jgi:hypothetical protein|uniref:Uncharacterized protein n=1 Tax=Nocardiopsis sinuspersici TaxID=501010 RepID=A0A7Z0BHA2_9ACTN|nr:hypothetical protein [Nocardiopsis sinuspersici]
MKQGAERYNVAAVTTVRPGTPIRLSSESWYAKL